MGYAEAIEQQAIQAKHWRSALGRADIDAMWEQYVRLGYRRPLATRDELHALHIDGIGQAEPYFIADRICDLLYGAADTLPDVTFVKELLPAKSGFVWLAKPLAFPMKTPLDHDLGPFNGFWWTESSWISPAKEERMIEGCYFGFLHTIEGDAVPRQISSATWPYGETLREWGPSTPNRADYDVMHRAAFMERATIISLFLFVGQRILATSSRPITNHNSRRRIAREIEHVPDVHVVELRRREYQQHDESQSSGVEYSCQWLVRGHWHQYHTKEGLQPRWVAPYVKGPPEKPLRVAKQTAYAVVR